MKIRGGFTVLEIFVSVAVFAILTSIGVNSLQNFRENWLFEVEVSDILQSVRQARNNAISRRNCLSSQGTDFWQITVAPSSSGSSTTIDCYYTDINDDQQTSTTYQSQDQVLLNATPEFYFRELGASDFSPVDTSNIAKIKFFPGGLYSQLLDNNGNEKEAVKVVFTSSLGKEATLCFEAIAGFPTLNTNSTECAQ